MISAPRPRAPFQSKSLAFTYANMLESETLHTSTPAIREKALKRLVAEAEAGVTGQEFEAQLAVWRAAERLGAAEPQLPACCVGLLREVLDGMSNSVVRGEIPKLWSGDQLASSLNPLVDGTGGIEAQVTAFKVLFNVLNRAGHSESGAKVRQNLRQASLGPRGLAVVGL